MIKKKKDVTFNKVRNGVEKSFKITAIIVRIALTLVGVAALFAFVFAAVKLGQALNLISGNIIG